MVAMAAMSCTDAQGNSANTPLSYSQRLDNIGMPCGYIIILAPIRKNFAKVCVSIFCVRDILEARAQSFNDITAL